MATQSDTELARRRKQIAASYKRRGYRVTSPVTAESNPEFLGDFQPDIIAQTDGDQVVIEVKRSRALKGSNELTELARRVSTMPGWRLELVALDGDGDESRVLASDWLELDAGTSAAWYEHGDALRLPRNCS